MMPFLVNLKKWSVFELQPVGEGSLPAQKEHKKTGVSEIVCLHLFCKGQSGQRAQLTKPAKTAQTVPF